ncbi:hypothetical protein [Blastococcus xanthinilyticus]|uniref:Thymidylate kinase n=1 Tax=Blastococcus xanthinilyticus TaxID=1564164 RepID=A0A5S5CUD6_9ACTN|nr:hypothetical protein [Blastococcus xanthinilyticus]TYP87215.1 thymidylate kinase [Blastococcus xanthinilyticus]
MHQPMDAFTAALRSAGIERRPVAGAAPGHLVLAVPPDRLSTVDRCARAAGFVALPGAPDPAARRYAALDPAAGRFVVVEVPGPPAPGRPARRRGLGVAVLGPDGAGKSTLAQGIAEAFPLPVATVYMGLWQSGDAGPSAGISVRDAAARPFRAWARLLEARSHQRRGRLVVFDRYVYDARLPAEPPWATAKRLYFWFLSRTCPAPDVTLLLDLPGEVAFARKGENGVEASEAARRNFRALEQELGLHVIDATRSPEEVRGAALAVIWAACLARWRVEPVGAPVPAR